MADSHEKVGAKAPALAGKSVVVTGASRGIGLACARAMHGAGARVILVARGGDTLKTIADELGERTHTIVGDMLDAAAVTRIIAEVRALLQGVPDILVNNAGRFQLAAIENTSVAEFANTIRVNLTSQFALLHDFLPDMRERGAGHIVTIGSIADHQAFAQNAAYASSKFGARALHEVLREEVRGSRVRATLISPGPVDTPLWDEVNPDSRADLTPRARMLDAPAVANAVLYAVTRPAAVNIDELRLSRS